MFFQKQKDGLKGQPREQRRLFDRISRIYRMGEGKFIATKSHEESQKGRRGEEKADP
jgi:hypothetical protein